MLKSDTLTVHDDGTLCYITFPSLDKTGLVAHAFSTRMGGVSTGIHASMNLSFWNGDRCENVYENYRRICRVIGADQDKLVFGDQQHGSQVRIVTEKDAGKGIVRERDYTCIDGLVTNRPGLPLATLYADCVPLLFCDPVKRVIAASHAGWKGTVGEIGLHTVKVMEREFGSDPEDILAGIAPSIGPCCYEVDEPVYRRVAALPYLDMNQAITEKGDGKYMLNLWETNRQILMQAGILPQNITVTDLCTCCHADLLHSHRATGGRRGSLAAIIMLK